jgi:hypothetical protein
MGVQGGKKCSEGFRMVGLSKLPVTCSYDSWLSFVNPQEPGFGIPKKLLVSSYIVLRLLFGQGR